MLTVLIMTSMLSSAPDLPPPPPDEPVVIYNKEALLPKETVYGFKKTDDENEESDENEAKLSPTNNEKLHFRWLNLRRFKVLSAFGFNRRGVRNH